MSHSPCRDRISLGTLIAGLFAAVACGPTGPYIEASVYKPGQMPQPQPDRLEVIRPNDLVSVNVFGQEPMSVSEKVRSDGMLTIPLIGEYPVAMKRPADLAAELEQRMAPFVASPHVTVVIQASPVRVTVIGETGSSLQQLEWPLIRLVDALAAAGGLTEFADRSAIFVLRGRDRIRFDYEDITRGAPFAKDFVMQTGDVVVVE